VPDGELVVCRTGISAGTIHQLAPFEAIVKDPHEQLPHTNGWTFFALDIPGARTTINDPRENACRLFFAGHILPTQSVQTVIMTAIMWQGSGGKPKNGSE
jgi:hypothetical protein